MPTTLIIGCGDVGGRLARRLVAAGHDVHGLRRSPGELPGARMHQADVRAPFTLQLPPLDYLCILLSPGASTAEAYRQTYVDSLAHIHAAVPAGRLRRVILVSSTSVYGEDDGSWVDEDTPARPAGFQGEVLLQSEQRARACWPVLTVLRLAGIYGEGRTWLLRRAASGQPVAAGQWSNRIHAADAAALLELLLQRDAAGLPVPELCLGVDDQPALLAEVLDGLAARQGLPPLPRLPETRFSGRRISNWRARELGFAPRYPGWREGYDTVLAAAGRP